MMMMMMMMILLRLKVEMRRNPTRLSRFCSQWLIPILTSVPKFSQILFLFISKSQRLFLFHLTASLIQHVLVSQNSSPFTLPAVGGKLKKCSFSFPPIPTKPFPISHTGSFPCHGTRLLFMVIADIDSSLLVRYLYHTRGHGFNCAITALYRLTTTTTPSLKRRSTTAR